MSYHQEEQDEAIFDVGDFDPTYDTYPCHDLYDYNFNELFDPVHPDDPSLICNLSQQEGPDRSNQHARITNDVTHHTTSNPYEQMPPKFTECLIRDAMAYRKVQDYKNNKAMPGPSADPAPNNISYRVNPGAQKAMEKLFEVAKQPTFQKNPERSKGLPPGFFNPKHRRNTSTGNSPLGSMGGSDDGISVTPVNTLSPPSLPGFPPYHHKRAPSAPGALDPNSINFGHQEHPQQPYNHPSSLSENSMYSNPNISHKQTRSSEQFTTPHYGEYVGPHPSEISNNIGGRREISKSLPQQSFMPYPDIPMGSLQPPNVDTRGPLPPNWEYRLDNHGTGYFVDHTNKTTTWWDPRPSPEAQRPSEYQANYYHQVHNPSNHHQHYPVQNQDYNASTYQRVQQLENERSSLQERQAQIVQAGLLAPENSPRFPQSPMEMGYDYHQYPRLDSGNPHMTSPYGTHARTISGDSGAVTDSGMDVEYNHGMMQNQYNAIGEINHHDFARYMQLNENQPLNQQRIQPFQ